MDPHTYQPTLKTVMKDEDGNKLVLSEEKLTLSKYTLEQQNKINSVNTMLTDQSLPVLTEEEIEYLLYPPEAKNIETSPEDFQKLSGVVVEKKIMYTDKEFSVNESLRNRTQKTLKKLYEKKTKQN